MSNEDFMAIPETVDTTVEAAITGASLRMAHVFARECSDKLVFVEGEKEWYVWGGMVWRQARHGEPQEIMEEFLAHVKTDYAKADPSLAKLAEKCLGSVRNINEALEAASWKLARRVDEFDADPHLVNTTTGVVDLTRPQQDPLQHNPKFLMRKITSGGYRRGMTHPDFEEALKAVPEDSLGWFQRVAGQAISGWPNPAGWMLFLQGGGSNGKSVLVSNCLLPAYGSYGLLARRTIVASAKVDAGQANPEMAALAGKRLVIVEELMEGRSLDMSSVKEFLDTPMVSTRQLYGKQIQFPPMFTMMATSNFLPTGIGTDEGSWRRLEVLNFPYRFVDSQELVTGENDRVGDIDLKSRIRSNLTGQMDAVITWAIEGAFRVYGGCDSTGAITKGALASPASAREFKTGWRSEADEIQTLWDEYLVADPEGVVTKQDLYEVYKHMTQQTGRGQLAVNGFSNRFKGHRLFTENGCSDANSNKTETCSFLHLGFPAMRAETKVVTGKSRRWYGFRFRHPGE